MDQAAPNAKGPRDDRTTDRVAEGRPEDICAPTYAEVAHKLLDQGYEPVPLEPGKKKPIPTRWTSVRMDEAQVDVWVRDHGHCGVGLRTGRLVAAGFLAMTIGYAATIDRRRQCLCQSGLCHADRHA